MVDSSDIDLKEAQPEAKKRQTITERSLLGDRQ
jgi:hypothetical protein